MNNKLKEIFNHSIIYGLGSIAQTAIAFILIPLYTRQFTVEEYGVYAMLVLTSSLSSAFFYFGGLSALNRSFFDYDKFEDIRKVVSISFFISLCGATFQVILAYFFKEKLSFLLFHSEAYSNHIFLIMLSSSLTILNGIFLGLYRLQKKAKIFVISNISIFVLSGISIILLLFVFGLGLLSPILGSLMTQAGFCTIFLILNRRYLTFKGLIGFNNEIIKQFKYGFLLVISGILQYIFVGMDRFFVNRFLTLSDVGVYALGFQVASLMKVFITTPFGMFWHPLRMEYRKEINSKEIYSLVITYFLIITSLFILPVALFSKELIMILSDKSAYLHSIKVIPVIMIGMALYGLTSILDNGLVFNRKVHFHALLMGITVVIVFTLNLMFIKRVGFVLPAYSYLIGSLVFVFGLSFFSNKYFTIHVDWGRILKIICASLIVLYTGYLLNKIEISFVSIIFRIVLFGLYLLFVYFVVVSQKEKVRLKELFVKGNDI